MVGLVPMFSVANFAHHDICDCGGKINCFFKMFIVINNKQQFQDYPSERNGFWTIDPICVRALP
jgi:hypothetical protein